MAALIGSLDARQAKLDELQKWYWVPGYGSYLGIRTLADKDSQELNRVARTLQEQQALKNASAERLRTAQAAWTNLAAERSHLVAERSAATAMRDNLDQRMKAAREATVFLIDAKQFWSDVATFIDFQANGAVSRANVVAKALLGKMGKPASDALILGMSAQQANLRGQLIQLSGQLERGQGFAALAAADCAPRLGAAPIKACNITPTLPFYQITNFETCSFRYVNPPGCPPAAADHRPAAMTPQQEWDLRGRMAKDQNWIGLARCTSPAAIYLGQVPTEYECAAACLGAADCRFWTFNHGNRMMPGRPMNAGAGRKTSRPRPAIGPVSSRETRSKGGRGTASPQTGKPAAAELEEDNMPRATKCHAWPAVISRWREYRMNVLNEQMTRSETSNDAPLIALGKERVAAWVRYRGRQHAGRA
jgi:hypothetical protein